MVSSQFFVLFSASTWSAWGHDGTAVCISYVETYLPSGRGPEKKHPIAYVQDLSACCWRTRFASCAWCVVVKKILYRKCANLRKIIEKNRNLNGTSKRYSDIRWIHICLLADAQGWDCAPRPRSCQNMWLPVYPHAFPWENALQSLNKCRALKRSLALKHFGCYWKMPSITDYI